MNSSKTHNLLDRLDSAIGFNVLAAIVVTVSAFVAAYTLGASFAVAGVTMSLSPGSGSYKSGQSFTVDIRANTNGQNVNAVQADLSYPTDKLKFKSISASGSAFGIAAESSGGSGNVYIGRGSTSDVSGSNVLVAKVTFEALGSTGAATVSFKGSSALVRSSDSSNILDSTNGGSFTITQATTSPPPATDDKKEETSDKPKTSNSSDSDKPTSSGSSGESSGDNTSGSDSTAPKEKESEPKPTSEAYEEEEVTLLTGEEEDRPDMERSLSSGQVIALVVGVGLPVAAIGGVGIGHLLRRRKIASLATSGKQAFTPGYMNGSGQAQVSDPNSNQVDEPPFGGQPGQTPTEPEDPNNTNHWPQ